MYENSRARGRERIKKTQRYRREKELNQKDIKLQIYSKFKFSAHKNNIYLLFKYFLEPSTQLTMCTEYRALAIVYSSLHDKHILAQSNDV